MLTRSESFHRQANDVEIFLLTSESSESLLIALIEEFGSIELGVGISSQPTSLKLIETLKSVTNGFLVLNAVYLENQLIRLPYPHELKTWEKDWNLPLNWLSPGTVNMKTPLSREIKGRKYPIGSLKTMLKAHGIKAFLTAEWPAVMIEGIPGESQEISDVLSEDQSHFLAPH